MRNMPAHGGNRTSGFQKLVMYTLMQTQNEYLSTSLTSICGFRFHHQQSLAQFSWNKSLASRARPMWDIHSVGYGLHERGIGFWFPPGDEIFLSSKIQTGFGVQQVSYLMDAFPFLSSLRDWVVGEWSGSLLAFKNPWSFAVPSRSFISSWRIS